MSHQPLDVFGICADVIKQCGERAAEMYASPSACAIPSLFAIFIYFDHRALHAHMGEIGECYCCSAYEQIGGAETLPV